jgi:Fur family zinc uptake transcriptional regulator
LAKADALVRARGVALTPNRRRVLALVMKARRPIGAYSLLADLATAGAESRPPTVYRALHFLVEHGLVHRLESRHAFIACERFEGPHFSQFVLCRQCGAAKEVIDALAASDIERSAQRIGFRIEHQVIELLGLCADCARGAPGPGGKRGSLLLEPTPGGGDRT